MTGAAAKGLENTLTKDPSAMDDIGGMASEVMQ
jgi:hypothetical protein